MSLPLLPAFCDPRTPGIRAWNLEAYACGVPMHMAGRGMRFGLSRSDADRDGDGRGSPSRRGHAWWKLNMQRLGSAWNCWCAGLLPPYQLASALETTGRRPAGSIDRYVRSRTNQSVCINKNWPTQNLKVKGI